MKKRLVSTYDHIQVALIHPIYKTYKIKAIDELGNTHIEEKEKLVKQIQVRKWFKKDAIVSVEEYVTTRNKIAKDRSVIYDRYSGRFYATFHNPKELWDTLNTKNKIVSENHIGFK